MQKTASSSYVNGLADVGSRANLLASTNTFDPTDPSRLVETFGPTRSVGLGMVSSVYVDGRDHTKTTYDEGAPNSNIHINGKAYGLPTTVVNDVYRPDTGQYTTDADADITHFGYDAVGSMAAASITGWSLGLPTTSTVQMGASPSSADLTTRTVYDADGRTMEVRLPGDSDGTTPRTTKTAYYTVGGASPCGSAIWAGMPCTTSPGGQPSTGSPLPVTTYTYNDYDDIVTSQAKYGATAVSRTGTTTFDGAQRPIKSAITVAGATVTAIPATTTTYDQTTGLPATASATAGTTTTTLTTTYDSAGRVRTYHDATGNLATRSYDIDGRPIDVTNSAGSTSWSYETATEKRGLPTGTSTTVGSSTAAFTGTYDTDGNLSTQTYPGGMTAKSSFLQDGAPAVVSYAKAGRTWLKFTRALGLGSRATRVSNALGSASTSNQAYAYDHAGRLIKAADTVGNACTTRVYGFDSHSNRTQLSSYPGGTGGGCSTTTTPTVTGYAYDTADRLTADTAGTTTWDALGRSTALPAGDAIDDGTTRIAGNLGIGYYANDLVRSQTQATSTTTFDLDPLASRISKRTTATQTNGITTTTTSTEHFNGNSDSPAWTELSASMKTVYVRGIDGTVAAVIDVDGSTATVKLQLSNPHGDLVATSTPTATSIPTDYHETTEYGIPRDPAAASPNYSWLGSQRRSGNALGGLILMGVRLYNPHTGTFTSTDPIYGGNANEYTYPSDPINQFDLDGRAITICFGSICRPASHYEKPGSAGGPGRGQRFPKSVKDQVLRPGASCVYCGVQTNLQADHIIPRSKGGNNTALNAQAACAYCNNSKGAGGAPKTLPIGQPPGAAGPGRSPMRGSGGFGGDGGIGPGGGIGIMPMINGP